MTSGRRHLNWSPEVNRLVATMPAEFATFKAKP
jgi:hypothetical protein